MFGVDSDDGFEDETPQRIDENTGPAKVERRLEKWDELVRTLSDDEEDGTKKDAKEAAAAYARLVDFLRRLVLEAVVGVDAEHDAR